MCTFARGKIWPFRASFMNDETIRWFGTKYIFCDFVCQLISQNIKFWNVQFPCFCTISLYTGRYLLKRKSRGTFYLEYWKKIVFAFKFIARAVLFQMFLLFVRNCKMMPIFKLFARFFYGFLGFAFTFFLAMLPDVASNSISIYIFIESLNGLEDFLQFLTLFLLTY